MPNEPNSPSLDQMRQNYTLGGLLEQDVATDPLVQFQCWFDEAGRNVPTWLEINAMTLCTSDLTGKVSSRIVLLKGIEDSRLLFYTNYDSLKGRQIAANPRVRLSFYWPHLQRQIHVTGTATKTDRETSRIYFESRPRDSQLGAHVSQQSATIASREVLESAMKDLQEKYPEGTVIPLPEHWGGYAVTPIEFEFWQGRVSRLHDRIVYQKQPSPAHWEVTRRAP